MIELDIDVLFAVLVSLTIVGICLGIVIGKLCSCI